MPVLLERAPSRVARGCGSIIAREIERPCMSKFNKDDILSAAKYLFVGGSSAVIELALFQLLVMMGLALAVANVVAVVIATAYNFLLNRSWSFGHTGGALASLVKYLLLFAFNTCFSTIAISTISPALGIPAIAVKVVTMGCIVVWNYVLYRSVIFK